jgi:hypothetical protein
MATEKQIAANRQNAQKSTGPNTERGKRRSRRNAIRHGLMAETVIDVLEDAAAYKALQRAIHTDYRPKSNFELELTGRLVSLLWRPRRAVAIESGLLGIPAKALCKQNLVINEQSNYDELPVFYAHISTLVPKGHTNSDQGRADPNGIEEDTNECLAMQKLKYNTAHSFMQVSRIESDVFERLGRYEMRLWRQAVQVILLLNSINHGSKNFALGGDKYFRLGNAAAKRQRTLWPPFVTSK